MIGPAIRYRSIRVLSCLLAAAAAAVCAGVSPASAQPAADDIVRDTTLVWPGLGLPSSVDLDATSSRDFTIPVPQGARGVVLTGQIRSAQGIGDAQVAIDDAHGRPVASFGVSAAPGTSSPFTADLSALPVVDGAVSMRMMLRPAHSPSDRCSSAPAVTLFDLATTFGIVGTAPPRTVQDFLPPVLTGMTVKVPRTPTAAEQQAALDLVTAVTTHYLPAPVDVRIAASDAEPAGPPAMDDPLHRTVVITEGGDPAVTVERDGDGRRYLAISGSAQTLPQQASLFTSQTSALAQGASVTVTEPGGPAVHGTDTLTFGQLGASAQALVLGRTDAHVGFAPTAFGSPGLGAARVRLLADYTPVHPDDTASLVIESAGVVVQTLRLDESGHVDRSFDLPTQMSGRSTGITMQLTFTPRGGCTPFTAPMSFRTDPRSTVSVVAGADPRGGFASLPLAFAPSVQVALGDSDSGHLSRAAAVLQSIQRLTATPLNVVVVPPEEAASSGSGALVVADAATVEALKLSPPLSGSAESARVDLATPLSATVSGGLGSIQAFTHGGRTVVLVTASGDWAPVDRLLSYAAGLDDGWASLSGDVLVAGVDGEPATLTVRTDGSPRLLAETPTSWRRWLWLGGAALIVAAASVGATWVRRRRPAAAGSRAHRDD